MAGDSSKGKTDDGKEVTARAEWKGRLPLQLLKKITSDFFEERILSTDELVGTVYKGTMKDGEMVAVHKFEENSAALDENKFISEVQNISFLQHENVVQLVGACYETYKKVVQYSGRYITADIVHTSLCYEYLPNGNLRKKLFEAPTKIDWEARFKIIKGICQGLLFLHSTCTVHSDLRPEYILLDNNMRPKIAYTGLGRFFRKDSRWRATEVIVRSIAYLAPEYLYRGEISAQSDIYSLGLLIIEISTGDKQCPSIRKPSALNFCEKVREEWTEEHIASQYPSLEADCLKQIKTCIEIGLMCVETDRRKRPSIEKIVDMLDGVSQIGSDSLLGQQPRQINFPIEPKRLLSSSLYLRNNTDDPIAFRLVTKIPRRYLTKLPFYGIVPPKCTYTLTVITREQKKPPPPSNSDGFLTLQSSSTAHHEDIDDVNIASVAVFLDAAGDQVQEAEVSIACESLAETISNDQIIDGQKYREVLSIDVHPTEPWILTSNRRGYVCIWNYQTHAQVDSIEVTREPVYSAKFIEREEWLVVGSGDGCIYVYNYNTMEEVDMIEAHDSHCVMCLAVNPTHTYVVSASDDHKVKLWDWTDEWQCIRTFEGHDDTVTQVMFNPRNSESFASASLDHTVKVWDIHSTTCDITWDGHPDGLLCVQYHPRYFQQFLISGSLDGAAKVWDLETDTCVDTLQEHAEGLSTLCWHPELRVLVTGSLDGTVRIWDWKSTSSRYRLKNIIGVNLGAVHSLGYLKGLTRIAVGCDQGIALMEINVL